MSTSLALSSMAVAQSSAALAESSRTHDALCKLTLAAYDAKSASVDEMRSYSECVQRIHPKDVEIPVPLAKAGVAILIIALIAGAVWGWQEDGPVMAFLGALMGVLAVLTAGVVLYGILAGLLFLFS
jgi:hypothetical protein